MSKRTDLILDGECAGPLVCPLSSIKAGTVVCIKQLALAPELSSRLREMGFCEEQKIKLLSGDSTFICQVCNARLGISRELAETILVQALPSQTEAA
jgi:Fe2+ transport system protein FeoA